MKKKFKKLVWEDCALFMFGCLVALICLSFAMSQTACKSPVVKKDKEAVLEKAPEECTKEHYAKCLKKHFEQPLQETEAYNDKGNLVRIIPKSRFNYEDIVYVMDYRVEKCFALHAEFGFANVSCTPEVRKLIKNRK